MHLGKILLKGKVTRSSFVENIADEIRETLSQTSAINKWSVIEISDSEKRSQHVAFLDASASFFDQDGPDGQIRLWESLEDLLSQYKDIFGNCYYQVYSLNDQQEKNIDLFLTSF